MSDDFVEIRWPTLRDARRWLRAVLGIQDSEDEGQALRDAMDRRYDDISRCC